MAMKRVGVAELKNQLSKHLRAVEAGAGVEMTDHDRLIARIVPVLPANRVVVQSAAIDGIHGGGDGCLIAAPTPPMAGSRS